MQASSAPTFGKRRPPGDGSLARPEQRPERASPDALAAFIAQERASLRPTATEAAAVAQAIRVPDSVRASVLAGLLVSFLTIGANIQQSAELGASLGTLTINGVPIPLVPLVLMASLWEGGRATATSLFVVHWALKRMARTSLIDYALAGAAVSLAYAGGVAVVGLGRPDHGYIFEAATGAIAGLLYRLLAGTVKRY
jgi:hypothetical protein